MSKIYLDPLLPGFDLFEEGAKILDEKYADLTIPEIAALYNVTLIYEPLPNGHAGSDATDDRYLIVVDPNLRPAESRKLFLKQIAKYQASDRYKK